MRFGKDTEFIKELRKRVRAYFRENDISMHGDWRMYTKSAAMITLYFAPFLMMLIGVADTLGLMYLMFSMMGLGLAGIGLCIMHDANHGAYSAKQKVNRMMGNTLNIVGGYAPTWRFQHNVLHHTFTNIEGMDEDIDPGGIMRFSPHSPRKKMHRFQFLYAWFFYGLMTFFWVTFKDFLQLQRYKQKGMLKAEKKSYNRLVLETALWKVVYYAYFFIPLFLLTDFPWWGILSGFFLMHFIAGLLLGIVFQPAHVVNETKFPLPNEHHSIENGFAIHQLLTTQNFARNNRVLSWFLGGLNYQVEHHLFPNICHIHYRKIAPIVKQTAEEYGLPYMEQKTFSGAIVNHAKMLYKLGKSDATEYREYPVYQ